MNRQGQSTTESIVLFPFFLLLVFGLLQLGQLATAFMVANYAASSIARKAVQLDTTGSEGVFQTQFDKLLTVGMRNAHADVTSEGNPPLSNVKVDACAEVDAFPFVGQFLGKILKEQLGTGSSQDCAGLRYFAFNSTLPARFVVHGQATARMNYQPG